jgi:methyltransferase-like protein/trans-aconitate methyltransferase
MDSPVRDPATPVSSEQPTSYDEVPYGSQAFAQTHPDRLATMARLFGLAPPDITHCRVLELGCASGGNLIPMAYGLPNSQFVGIDLSRRQVEEAWRTIRALDTRNVRIEHSSIMDVDASWGTFDYIICHGVFSWVERPVQDKILQIAAERLSEDGVAYISYNTYPGWHMRESIRHMMRHHAAQFDTPAEQVSQARALIEFLAAAAPPDSGAYGQMLSGELDLLRKCADWYLYHEHLEQTNTPVYFHQFIERAQHAGLQYLSEAEFSAMLTSRFPPPVAETLERVSPDILHLEQYMDFVRNRHFRQTLLCKRTARLSRALGPQKLHGLAMASSARPTARTTDLSPGYLMEFHASNGVSVQTEAPATKAALLALHNAWPLALEVDMFCPEAIEQVQAKPDDPQSAVRALMQHLFQFFLAGAVELHTWSPDCTTRPSAQPKSFGPARYQAETQTYVVNAWHSMIELDTVGRAILAMLDGTRTLEVLVNEMMRRVEDGRLTLALQGAGTQALDAKARRAVISNVVDEALSALASKALLSG